MRRVPANAIIIATRRLLETLSPEFADSFLHSHKYVEIVLRGKCSQVQASRQDLGGYSLLFNFQERKSEASKVVALFDDELIRFTSY
jgi:hypothetical protein